MTVTASVEINLPLCLATIAVNVVSSVVLFFYQRRRYRNIKIVLFNLFVIHILSALNQLTAYIISDAESRRIMAGTKDITAFLLLVYCLNLDILGFQCTVNATKILRNVLEKRMQNVTIVSVLCCWLIPVLVTLPLIFLQIEENNNPKQLLMYFQGVLLVTLVNLVLVLVCNVYVAFRTWVKVDPNNIISFNINQKNVVMTIATTVFYAVSVLLFITFHLGGDIDVSSGLVRFTMWIDKILVPLVFLLTYAAKHFYLVLKRAVKQQRHQQAFRQMSGDNNVTVINSFTHVQPALSKNDEMSENPSSPDSLKDFVVPSVDEVDVSYV